MTLKETKNLSANRYELTIAISAEELAEAVKKAYESRKADISIPGFRKGKVPFSMVVKMYGEEAFYEDALNILYPDAVDAAIKESGLKIINDKMDTDIESISKEDGVVMKVAVTTYPEIEIGEYKGLKAEKLIAKVEDSEVDAQINAMAQRNARMVSVEDRAAQMGDTAVIDFEGFKDGVAFEGGKGEGYSLELGSGSFIPGFEEQIVGKNIGEEFDIVVTFPEEYGAEELAGKEATFKIKLHEIKFQELPEIDDEFAKDVSEFDTLDELKADIKEKALAQKAKIADEEAENELVQQIVDSIKGEIPEAMFESRLQQSVEEFGYRLQMQGLDLDTYLKYSNTSMDDFKATFRPQAEAQVKFRLALEKIVELEKIEADDEAIEAEFKKLAEAYGMEVEAVKNAIPASELAKDVAVQKAIDFIKENAVITEVEAKTEKKPAAKKKTTTAKKTTKKAEEAAE
ncbi:MAG: trigger factor [Clostridia bacterium]|nr:trigger factor [Clostridia bacterium]